MRILCVDDEKSIQKLYQSSLAARLRDDEVVVVGSGEEALEALKESLFDVVITDLSMPGISGLEVLRHVKLSGCDSDVLIVTGAASLESAVEALKLGAKDYIEKPVVISLLVEKLENIREYQKRLREAEDLRLTKELSEKGARESIYLLEERLQEMMIAVKKCLHVLDQLNAENPSDRLQKVIDSLRPLCRHDDV